MVCSLFFTADIMLPLKSREVQILSYYRPSDLGSKKEGTSTTDLMVVTTGGSFRINAKDRSLLKESNKWILSKTQLMGYVRSFDAVESDVQADPILIFYGFLRIFVPILTFVGYAAYSARSRAKLFNLGSSAIALFLFGVIIAFFQYYA